MILALEIILVVAAVLMTIFVLLHKGKGGGLSSLFGGGVQSNLSGFHGRGEEPGPLHRDRGAHLVAVHHHPQPAGYPRLTAR